MFRALIYPSSGACDCAVELPVCSRFVVCWSRTKSPTHIEPRTHDQCGNSTAQSQAPDDGYINVRNMLSA